MKRIRDLYSYSGLATSSCLFKTSFLFAVISCCANIVSLHAQKAQFEFERVSVENGLAQCTVNAIFQDRQGFLWFGTADGLNRYDGYEFKYYKHDPSDTNSLSHNNVLSITEDRNGMLWFGTGGEGLNKFDRTNGKFTHYKHNSNDRFSLSNNYIHHLYCDPLGTIWIGTYDGLNAFDPETEKFVQYRHDPKNSQSLTHPYVRYVYEDRARSLWVIDGAALHRFEHHTGSFKGYALAPLLPSEACNSTVSVYEDHLGTFWVGTLCNGLLIFDREKEIVTNQFQHDPRDSTSLLDDEVAAICEDITGALWVGTRKGVNRWDRATRKFTRFRHDPRDAASISYGNCTRIFRDRSGLMWFATDGSGLSKLDPRSPKFAHYRHEPVNPNSLSLDLPKAICEDRNGDLWIGTNQSGVDRLNRRTGKVTHYPHDPNNPWTLPYAGVTAIFEDHEGILWLGCNGLSRFERVHERFAHAHNEEGKRLGLPREVGNTIYEDREGNIWVGGEGVSSYDKRTGQTISYRHEPENPTSLSSSLVTVIYEDRHGVLWIGTAQGLNKFHCATETFTRYFHDPADAHSLSYDYIKTIFEDREGNLWIGTTDGLNKFDATTETFVRYHEKDGLPNTFIYGILGDDNGNLWLSTNNGLSKFHPATGEFRNYEVKDGLQSREFNTGAYHRSKITGEMFFGGINGVNVFHPDSVGDSPFAPAIVLTDFKKFDSPVQLEVDIADLNEIVLTYEENVFSFEFAALDYTHPEKNQYAYMMEGFEKDWVYCGARRFARYTNLNPGTYTFRVKGTNHDGVWNEHGTALKITIVPPFWMTWWFKLTATLAVLGAVAGAAKYLSVRKFKLRLLEYERQHALSRERERISKDMHDEIGANLTKMAILSELVQKESGSTEHLQNSLRKISETARATIDSMSEIIWALNPQNNTLDNLAAYLRKYAADFFDKTSVQCHLDFPEAVPGHTLSSEFRRHIFMVVKEAAHNIVKHAHASEVKMKFLSQDHTLEIFIQDNGKGFCPNEVTSPGNGLRNMSRRMAELGGRFELVSQPKGGTTVKIWAKPKSS